MARKYLDSDGLGTLWGKIKSYVTNSIKVTGVKGANESSYRTGNVNLTPHNIGAAYGVNEILNAFAPEKTYAIQIDRLENAFYFADKRWTVTAVQIDANGNETTLSSGQVSSFFDMSESSQLNVPAGGKLIITLDFSNDANGIFPNYPYGYVYLGFYYTKIPDSVSARVYGKHTGSDFYWRTLTVRADARNVNGRCRYIIDQNVMYNMQKLEITVNGKTDDAAGLQEISYYMTRADKNKDMPYVSKLRPETLYYDLTAPKVTTPIVETGNTTPSYFQTERLRGEGNASTYYHAIDFGRHSHNQVDFYEYGGIFNFHKHTGSTIDIGDTLLGTINDKGWDGKVNNHTINADVPADAVFTDTTYESKAAAENGTALSLVTTGEKYLWNNAASGTGSASWDNISGKPTETGESTTGISIGNHATGTVIGVQSSTTSVTGVQSSTTTASKVTLGTALSIPNVTGASDVTVPKAATSATTVPIKNATATSIPNVTNAGSGSASLTFTMDETDTKKLIINFSHTHTPPTLGTPISITGVQSTTTSVTGVSGSTTASKVTLGTAISVPNVTNVSDVTVPIKATSATTVPIKNTSASTFVTGTTHTITDNGHTHSIS